MPSSPDRHETQAAAHVRTEAVRCAVLTISDTRTAETDQGGPLIARLLEDAGHTVSERSLIRDEPDEIRRAIEAWIADDELHVVICTGGTGIARRDTTIDVVLSLLSIELPGFGELFRMLSFEEVGAAAMLSRAIGGLVMRDPGAGGDTYLFSLPGSPGAIKTAMTKLIVPQLPHLVWERRR